MFSASVSTAHRRLSGLWCFFLLFWPFDGLVPRCLGRCCLVPRTREKQGGGGGGVGGGGIKPKPNQGVQSLEMKSKIAIPKCLPSAMKKKKKPKQKTTKVECAVHWSGQSCGIYSDSHTCGMDWRTRAGALTASFLDFGLPRFVAMSSVVCVV